MKKSTSLLLIIALIFVTIAGDCGPDIPNPGFGVVAVDRTGFISSFERALPDAVTDWHWSFDGESATGDRYNFFTRGGGAGQSLVDRGRAPAGYNIRAVSDWGPCTGLNGVQVINRGVYNYIPCRRIMTVGFSGTSFVFSPSPVDVSAAGAIDFYVTNGGGISTQFGMPYIEFTDEYGNLSTRTQATECDYSGTWAKASTACFAGLYPGRYGVEIVNQTSDGIGEVIGVADVTLVDTSTPPPCEPGQICQ